MTDIGEEDFNRTSSIEEDFEQIEVIEDDRFGEIIILQNKEIPEMYIMAKEKISSTIEEFERDLFQAKQRKKLNHPNLLQMPDYSTSVIEDEEGQKFLVCGFYEFPQWNLEKEIEIRKKEKKGFEEEELLRLIEDVMNCLCYLQKKKMLHGDIRPKYISFEDEDMPNKLVDRLGNPFPPNKVQINVLKNNLDIYMSPILFKSLSKKKKKIRHNPYKSDVFSFGIILLEAGILKNVNDIYDREKNEIDIEKFMGYVEEFLGNYENGKLIQESILWMLDLKGKTRVDPKKFMKKFDKLKIEIYGEEEENQAEQEQDLDYEQGEENNRQSEGNENVDGNNLDNEENLNRGENLENEEDEHLDENKEVFEENENPVFLGSQVFDKQEESNTKDVKNVIRTVESNSILFKYDQNGQKVNKDDQRNDENTLDKLENIVSAEHRFNPNEMNRNSYGQYEPREGNQEPTDIRTDNTYQQEPIDVRMKNSYQQEPTRIRMENTYQNQQEQQPTEIRREINYQQSEVRDNSYNQPTTGNNYQTQTRKIIRENTYQQPSTVVRENNYNNSEREVRRVSNYKNQNQQPEVRRESYRSNSEREVRRVSNYQTQNQEPEVRRESYRRTEVITESYQKPEVIRVVHQQKPTPTQNLLNFQQNQPNQIYKETTITEIKERTSFNEPTEVRTQNPNIDQQSKVINQVTYNQPKIIQRNSNNYNISNNELNQVNYNQPKTIQRNSNNYNNSNNVLNQKTNSRHHRNNYYNVVNSEKIIGTNFVNSGVSNVVRNERVVNGVNRIRYSLSHKANLSNSKVNKNLETNLYSKDVGLVNSPNFYENKYNIKTVVSSNKNEMSNKSENKLKKMSPQVLFKNFEREQELKKRETNIYDKNQNESGLEKQKTINEFLTEHINSQINLDNCETPGFQNKKQEFRKIPEAEKIKVKENLKDIQQLYKNSSKNIYSSNNSNQKIQNRNFANIINKNYLSQKNISKINREIYVPSNRTEEERRSYSNNIKKERLSTYDYDVKRDKSRNVRKYVLSRKTQSFLNNIDKNEGFNNIYNKNKNVDDYVKQVRDDNSELMERYNNCLEVRQENKNFKVFRVVL